MISIQSFTLKPSTWSRPRLATVSWLTDPEAVETEEIAETLVSTEALSWDHLNVGVPAGSGQL